MTQLSTDSLVYSQIVSTVQKFISSYVENKNVSPKDFDEAYQKLLFEIKESIGGPLSKVDFLNKGDIPSSERFNKFIAQLAEDMNIITHQFDSLTANYVNSFNILNEEIESEKSSIGRIRSKIGALELYSNSGSNNITYLGDLLNNMDLIDVSKSKNVLLCDVTEGVATLPKKNVTKWKSKVSLYNQNFNNFNQNMNTHPFGISNGLPGCNFLFTQETVNNIVNPFLFQKDTVTVKSDILKVADESPISFFEYEAISIPERLTIPLKTERRQEYEFEYINGTNYINWGSFGLREDGSFDPTKPLKMTVELTSTKSSGENINYISIIPFFGYDNEDMNAQIKNVKVTSIQLYNDTKTEAPYQLINTGPVYIGADISGANINNYKNFSYNKGIFRFPEVLVNKVYITFEQESFNDVTIKHAYWTPYSSSNFQNRTATTPTWHGQTHFDPLAEGVFPEGTSSSSISWNKSAIVPAIDKPNDIKSRALESVRMDISYATSSQVENNVLKLNKSTTESAFYSSRESFNGTAYYIFREAPSVNITAESINTIKAAIVSSTTPAPCVFIPNSQSLNDIKIDVSSVSISAAPNQIITVNTSEPHNLNVGSLVYIKGPVEIGTTPMAFDLIYTVATRVDADTFTVAHTGTTPLSVGSAPALLLSCFPVYALGTASSLVTAVQQRSVVSNRSEQVWLQRNYETINAKRASIGIRDIFLGKETYSDKAEIISKPFYIYDNIDLLSLEVSDQVPSTDESSTSIDYYISVDDGSTWIQISPTQRNFVGIPEILAFNQNMPNTSILPQIAYYNYPEVPNPIKSIRFRAVMKKDRNSNVTPILGSYKLGIRFRQ
jgi:hypothetical protein